MKFLMKMILSIGSVVGLLSFGVIAIIYVFFCYTLVQITGINLKKALMVGVGIIFIIYLLLAHHLNKHYKL